MWVSWRQRQPSSPTPSFPEERKICAPRRRSLWHGHIACACRKTVSPFGVPLYPLQIRSHVGCMLIAQIAIFLQGLVDDVFQLGRHVVIQPHHGHRGTVRDGFKNHCRAFATKRQAASSHLAQGCPKGAEVGTRIQLFRPHLLRRHISRRSHHCARTGQMLCIPASSEVVCVLSDAISLAELTGTTTFASPKSRILACPRLVMKTLAGLMSR